METAISRIVSEVVPGVDEVLDVVSHFDSAWARCFKVTARQDDGSDEQYFMKVSMGSTGSEALKGEFESTSLIYSLSPDFCPKPIAHGELKGFKDAHFYVCKFYEFFEGVPAPQSFCKKLADLHHNHCAPEGKFGFHVTTYAGNCPQKNTLCDSWETFFAAGLKYTLDIRQKRAGPNQELDALLPDLFDKVIPRLLRPLETHGRKIIPSLVHGDLWCGNTSIVDEETDEGLIYDPASFWAHNEYELGNWRPVRNQLTSYIHEYLKYYPESEPREDFDGRNLLYSMRFNVGATALFPLEDQFVDMVIQDIRELNAKFSEGYVEDEARPKLERSDVQDIRELNAKFPEVYIDGEARVKLERSDVQDRLLA